MKWFNNFIRITAAERDWMKHLDKDKQQKLRDDNMIETPKGNFGQPLVKKVQPKLKAPDLNKEFQDLDKFVQDRKLESPTPAPTPQQMNLPMDGMPLEDKHNNPTINPFYDIEAKKPTLQEFCAWTSCCPARRW